MNINGNIGYKNFVGNVQDTVVNYAVVQSMEKANPNYDPRKISQNRFKTVCSKQSFDDCLYGTLRKEVLEYFGCAPPILFGVTNEDICTNSSAEKSMTHLM